MGGTVLAVSVDAPELSAEVVIKNKLTFPVLADPDLKVIDAYGVRHPNGYRGRDHALPAVFLIDRYGVVRWKRIAHRVQDRPSSRRLFDAIAMLTSS